MSENVKKVEVSNPKQIAREIRNSIKLLREQAREQRREKKEQLTSLQQRLKDIKAKIDIQKKLRKDNVKLVDEKLVIHKKVKSKKPKKKSKKVSKKKVMKK